ncbi:AaceriAFR320Wp [[Ashbya] aceris (nom. inval.)]|nr:AaceriAFR320Wp [[Ashbya] aceris (nom. inval.)]
MSSTLINRSLATIRTELAFLVDSGVITRQQSQQIESNLPNPNEPPRATPANDAGPVEYVEAVYTFQAQQPGDLDFKVGEKIEVLEKPSPEWYKGRCNGKVGMFPSNYVKPAFSGGSVVKEASPPRYPAQPPVPQVQSPVTQSPPASYSQSPFPPGASSYYQHPTAAYPPPPAPYQPPTQYQSPPAQYAPPAQYQAAPVPYQAPPQAVVQPAAAPAEQGGDNGVSGAAKKFGSKLGNAAIFGAGATLGSDLVHSIF